MPTILDRLVTKLDFDTDLRSLRRFDTAVDRTKGSLGDLGKRVGIVGGAMTGVGALALVAFQKATGAAIDWETAFTGVQKTVQGTTEEMAHLERGLRRMAKVDIPLEATELAGVAEAAGQLGIQTPAILGFVDVMSKLGVTTNLTSHQAATDLARLANITQMPQQHFDRLGATIVDLGNNFATTEAELVEMALRIAGSGKLIGLTEAQVLGFATTLSSVGIFAEMGGTALSRVFVAVQKAVQTGTGELTTFAQVTGRTADEFQALFERDPAEAIAGFLDGLKSMIDAGESIHPVLEQLGFDNVRVRDTILRAAGAGDLLRRALETGNLAWEQNIALNREAELRFGTAASRIQLAKNALTELKIVIGGALAPTLTDLLDDIRPVLDAMAEFAERNPMVVKIVAGLALGLTTLGLALVGTAAAMWLFNVALLANPIGLVAVAVLGLVAAFGAAGVAAYVFRDELDKVDTWLEEHSLSYRGLKWAIDAVKDSFKDVVGPTLGWHGSLGQLGEGVEQLVDLLERLWDAYQWLDERTPKIDWGKVFGGSPTSAGLQADYMQGGFGETGRGSGRSFMDAFKQGVEEQVPVFGGALAGLLDYLPKSDARRGPLSHLTESGRAMMETFMHGASTALPDPRMFENIMANLAAPLPVGPAPVAAGAGAGGGFSFQMGDLIIERIEAKGADADTIAGEVVGRVGERLEAEVRTVFEEYDSQIAA